MDDSGVVDPLRPDVARLQHGSLLLCEYTEWLMLVMQYITDRERNINW